jgi:hypothetical protein
VKDAHLMGCRIKMKEEVIDALLEMEMDGG